MCAIILWTCKGNIYRLIMQFLKDSLRFWCNNFASNNYTANTVMPLILNYPNHGGRKCIYIHVCKLVCVSNIATALLVLMLFGLAKWHCCGAHLQQYDQRKTKFTKLYLAFGAFSHMHMVISYMVP